MAIITQTCSSRGASIGFTINDATLRVTSVQADTRARQVRVAVYDTGGTLVRQIIVPGNTLQTTPVDLPARLVEIERPDTSTKSYVCPIFEVFF